MFSRSWARPFLILGLLLSVAGCEATVRTNNEPAPVKRIDVDVVPRDVDIRVNPK